MLSYIATMTNLLSEAKSSIHEQHIYEFEAMVRQMIEELVPPLVIKTLQNTYFDLWVKLQMVFEGKEQYFKDVADYIMKELEKELKKSN